MSFVNTPVNRLRVQWNVEDNMERAWVQENLFGQIVFALPRHTRTATMMFTEQWVRFGLGMDEESMRSVMYPRELLVRGRLSKLQSSTLFAVPNSSLAEALFEELHLAAKAYCRVTTELFPGSVSRLHAEYMRDASLNTDYIFWGPTIDNSEERSLWLENFGWSMRHHELGALVETASTVEVMPAMGWVRTCSHLVRTCDV